MVNSDTTTLDSFLKDLDGLGICNERLRILYLIHIRPGINLNQLSQHACLRDSHVRYYANALEKEGLIRSEYEKTSEGTDGPRTISRRFFIVGKKRMTGISAAFNGLSGLFLDISDPGERLTSQWLK